MSDGGGYSSGGDTGYSGGSSDSGGAYIGGSSEGGYNAAMSGAYQGSSTSSYMGESIGGSQYGQGNAYNSSNSAGMAYQSDGIEGRLGPFNWETGGFGLGQPAGLAGLVAGQPAYGPALNDYKESLKESMGKFDEDPYKHHMNSCPQCKGPAFTAGLCPRCAVKRK